MLPVLPLMVIVRRQRWFSVDARRIDEVQLVDDFAGRGAAISDVAR